MGFIASHDDRTAATTTKGLNQRAAAACRKVSSRRAPSRPCAAAAATKMRGRGGARLLHDRYIRVDNLDMNSRF